MLHLLYIRLTGKEIEMRPKYELNMLNFPDRNRTKLRAHVSVDFGHEIRLRFWKCERGFRPAFVCRVNGTNMGTCSVSVSKKHYLLETIRNIQREQKNIMVLVAFKRELLMFFKNMKHRILVTEDIMSGIYPY